MAKKLFIKSYGCQMNAYDSARMADVLAPHGYVRVEAPDAADMVILNTCHIRGKATEKVYSDLGRIRRLKERRAKGQDGAGEPAMIIAVAGCVAQAEGAEMMRRAPFIDMVLGPQTYHRLPEMVARSGRTGQGVVDTEFPVRPKFDFLPEESGSRGPSAFVTVQEGCDRFCAFCVVPYTRGGEYSRPAADIVAEVRRLLAKGAREITLLGQNVNAYHGAPPGGGAQWGLGRLIRSLAGIEGLDRLRYTTSHPLDMDADLISAHGEVPQLMPYLHLPVQSGSDRVLAAMNRGHDAAQYRRLAETVFAARPDLALSSDFIVGHPGETDADFDDTLRLVREVGFAQAYSFKYSARPGTPASIMANSVAEEVKAERLATLQELLNAQQLAFNRRAVGTVVPVLFDRPGGRENQVAGRSPHMQAVHTDCDGPVAAAARMGAVVGVKIVSAHVNSLTGIVDADHNEGGWVTGQPETVPA